MNDEEIETIIDEETGEVIIDDDNEETEDFSSIDFSETPFPIVVVLNGETNETQIDDVKDLLYLIQDCEENKEKEDNEELNAEILKEYKNCFTLVIEEDNSSEKSLSGNDENSSDNNDIDDLIYPFKVYVKEKDKIIKIDDKGDLKDVIENCSDKNDDNDDDHHKND